MEVIVKRKEFEDDGRTVADMSSLNSGPSSIFGGAGQSDRKKRKEEGTTGWEVHHSPYEDPPFTIKERLYYAGAALLAALSIAAVFLAGIALIIWLITLHAG